MDAGKRAKSAIRLKTKPKASIGGEVPLDISAEAKEQAIIDETKPTDKTLIKAVSSDISEAVTEVAVDEQTMVSESLTSPKIAAIVEVPKSTTTPKTTATTTTTITTTTTTPTPTTTTDKPLPISIQPSLTKQTELIESVSVCVSD